MSDLQAWRIGFRRNQGVNTRYRQNQKIESELEFLNQNKNEIENSIKALNKKEHEISNNKKDSKFKTFDIVLSIIIVF